MNDAPQTTSAPPAAAHPADTLFAAARANSPLHQPVDPAATAVAERSAADPAHPRNTSAAVIDVTAFTQLPAREQAKYVARPGGEYALRDGQAAPPADKPGVPAADAPRLKVGDFELSEAEWRDLAAHKAAQDSRKATLPADPSGYKAELPEGVQLPGGVTAYQFDEGDPLLAGYRNLAHKFGLDQGQFGEGLSLIATMRANEQAQLRAAYDAEVGKLGSLATARVDAVIQWINGMMGPDAATLGHALKLAPVAGTIIAFEKLMHRFSSQGAASFSTAHQAPPPPNRPSEATWNGWSFSQRQNWQNTGNPNDNSWATTDGARRMRA